MKHFVYVLTILGLIGFAQEKVQAQCVAEFSFTTEQLNVACTNNSTGNYTMELWSFGDGTVPSGSSVHTYAAPGTYEICLTVTNILAGCFDFICYDVTVTEYVCEVEFAYSYNSSNVFQFQNASLSEFTSVEWAFGDGNTTTFANPSYTYNNPGTYEVCLMLLDGVNVCGVGCKNVDVYALGVSDLDTKDFSVYPNPSDRGEFMLSWDGHESEKVQLEVFDVTGRMVHRETLIIGSSASIVRWDAVSGSYFLKATNAEGNVTMTKVLVR